jgi:exopolysaccharide production protein ExoQ
MSALPPYAAPRGELWTPVWPAVRPGVTAAIVCAMFLCLLFVLQIGSLGVGGAIGLAVVLGLLNRGTLRGFRGPRSYLFAIPLLCMASAIWSEDPFISFRSGIELAVTVAIGLVLSVVDRRTEALAGIAAAFAIYTVIALAMGHVTGVGTMEAAFTGLNAGKNYMAEIASTGALLTLGLLAAAAESRKLIWLPAAAAAVVAAALEIYALMAARSAGAVIALGLGVAVMAGLSAVSRLSDHWRRAAIGFAVFVLGAVALFHDVVVREISDMALRTFDKDPTLTGRTYLWYRAHQMIAEKPIVGHGFNAFWRQGNPDAEGLWRFGNITSRTGFNFHNTGIELLMQFGWCGAFVVAGLFFLGAALLVRRFLLKPDAMTCMWLALTAFEIVRTFYESIGPAPFYFSNVLLIAAFGSAFRTPVLVTPSRS